MAGVCGAFRKDGRGQALPPGALSRMLGALVHRGSPASEYEAPGASIGALGADIARAADDAVAATLDGAILNRRELGTSDGQEGDARLLARLYAQWGTDFPSQLRGDFAAVVWDEKNRRGVLARDRQGIKPLYYAEVGDTVVFASELKAILASGLVEPELEYFAIDAFLSFGFVPGPRTAIRGVRKLHLGERLVVVDGTARIDPYWLYPPPDVPAAPQSEDEYRRRLIAELDESVRLRVQAAGGTGVFLSGGLDSAMVVALMARHTNEPRTFTVAFREVPATNELEAARQVARAFGTEHRELELSLVDDGPSVEELAWRMDEPLGELSPVGLFALAQIATAEVDAVLSGQGADGIFGGLPAHRTAALVAHLDWVPRPIRRGLATIVRGRGGRLERAARALGAGGAADRFLTQCNLVPDARRLRMMKQPLRSIGGRSACDIVDLRLRGVTGHPTATFIFLDEQLAAIDSVLHYNDRASTAGPVDVRFPFLDHHVVEFAATMPVSLKVKGFERKYLLRQAARDLLPAEVLDRPKVGFFNAAIDAWVRAQLDRAVQTYLLDPGARYAEFIDRGEVERLLADFRAAPELSGGGARLLQLLMLELWLAVVVPRAIGLAHDQSGTGVVSSDP